MGRQLMNTDAEILKSRNVVDEAARTKTKVTQTGQGHGMYEP